MLKKATIPTSNNSHDVMLIIQGAKKRRIMAHTAVKAVNTGFGIRPDLATVK